MKYFVFSDVHGDYDALMEAIASAGYDATSGEHTLVSCGDNFGRSETGKGSKGVYEYLTSLEHRNRPVCLRGNHECILRDMILRGVVSELDIYNGEDKTVRSMLSLSEKSLITSFHLGLLGQSSVFEWLLSLHDCFETEHHLFLHGFLPRAWADGPFVTADLHRVSPYAWYQACWADTPKELAEFRRRHPNGLTARDGTRKWLVFGHCGNDILRYEQTKTYAGDYSLWREDELGVYGLDGGTYYSHKLPMLVIEDAPVTLYKGVEAG